MYKSEYMRNLVAPDHQQSHLLSKNKRFRGIQNCLSGNRPGIAPMPRSPEPLYLALQLADQTSLRSPRKFGDGAVGLGIVAAQLRSEPIPIVSPRPRPRGEGWTDAGEADEDKEELSESYTCVISHVAGSAVRKRVYFDDGSDGVTRNYGASPGVFFQSPPAMKVADLMNRCYLCTKNLHGLDIFMYRGDKGLVQF